MTESFEELFRALHQFKKLNVVSMLPDELTKSFRPSPRLKLQKIREKWKSKNGVVRFEHVNFRYPGAEEDVLHDIDFVAESGKTTAIIGSTGCRKSTLVNLIPRLYDVTGGSITLDGKDIRRITMKDLRDEIGFVPQKGVLFSGTIASNLRFGKDDASDEEIAKAAEIAQATEFIEAKDDKYETPIAQGGSNVSGGQKQRLAIARAILADNKILILVMKDGDIIEQGNHEELLAANGFYANLYNSQFEDVVA